MTVRGGDISYWQDRNDTAQMPDFEKAFRHGWRFVFVRAMYGLTPDSDFKLNFAHSKGFMLRGPYHFMVWLDPIVQANAVWDTIKSDPGELPVVADFEPVPGVPTPVDAIDRLQRFCMRVEFLTGRIPIIYTNPSFWKVQYAKRTDLNYDWSRHALWIANYGVAAPSVPLPWRTYTFWQYSAKGDGKDAGMESLDVDEDFFNGTEEELGKFAGHAVINPCVDQNPITEQDVIQIRLLLTQIRDAIMKIDQLLQ